MRLNRRQLRRLIESAIYEQGQAKGQVVPKEVRAELTKLRLSGMTALGFDGGGDQGIAISINKSGGGKEGVKLAFSRLKKIYGEDRVVMGGVKRLQGGSAGIKSFGESEREKEQYGGDEIKDLFQEFFEGDDAIFIKMD